MIREQGLFSNRYLTRRGKQNHHQNNQNLHSNHNTNQINHLTHREHRAEECDFPLALTNTKVVSKERSSISVKQRKNQEKKVEVKNQEDDGKSQIIAKLEKELKDSKEQLRKANREIHNKTIQYETYIKELSQELKEKEDSLAKITQSVKEQTKKTKEESAKSSRYAESIKKQIYWLLNIFMKLQDSRWNIEDIRKQITNHFLSFKDYIQQFSIQKQLQQLASLSSIQNNQPSHITHASSLLRSQQTYKLSADSIFTQDLEELNMVKAMQMHPLIETFNNQQYIGDAPQPPRENSNDKMERITKKLFDDSPLFKDEPSRGNMSMSINDSLMEKPQKQEKIQQVEKPKKADDIDIELPRDVIITADFVPEANQDNFIALSKGKTLKLLRRIRANLWIGEFSQKIGLVLQDYFTL